MGTGAHQAGQDGTGRQLIPQQGADRLHLGAWAALVVWVGAVVAEHLVEPRLNPLRHMVSEYARRSSGAAITVGLLAWALSLLLTAAWLRRRGRPGLRLPGAMAALLLLAAVGLGLAACFRTQTSVGVLAYGERWSFGGRLHDLGSGITSLAMLLAAACGLRAERGARRFVRTSGALLAFALAADVALLPVGAEAGGLRQRLLMAAACAWQALLLGRLRAGISEGASIQVPQTRWIR